MLCESLVYDVLCPRPENCHAWMSVWTEVGAPPWQQVRTSEP